MPNNKVTDWLDLVVLGAAVIAGIGGSAGIAAAGIALYLTSDVIAKIKGH